MIILVLCQLQGGPVELLPFLFLGSAVHSSRRETLAAAGITAVLNVSSTCQNFYEGDFEYLRLTVEDSLAADIRACFSTAIAFIGECLSLNTRQCLPEPVYSTNTQPIPPKSFGTLGEM